MTQFFRRNQFLCGIVAGFLIALLVNIFCGILRSVDSMIEYEALQVVVHKWQDRSSPKKIIFESRGDYKIVGILSKDKEKRVWILLNPRCPESEVKKMSLTPPDYQISCEEFDKIIEYGEIGGSKVTDELADYIVNEYKD